MYYVRRDAIAVLADVGADGRVVLASPLHPGSREARACVGVRASTIALRCGIFPKEFFKGRNDFTQSESMLIYFHNCVINEIYIMIYSM